MDPHRLIPPSYSQAGPSNLKVIFCPVQVTSVLTSLTGKSRSVETEITTPVQDDVTMRTGTVIIQLIPEVLSD